MSRCIVRSLIGSFYQRRPRSIPSISSCTLSPPSSSSGVIQSICNMSTLKQTPIMEALTATLKSGPAQRCQDEFYKPRKQAHFVYTPEGQWTSAASRKDILTAPKSAINPKAIRLISWNIDMLVPFGKERMAAALAHLESVVSSTPSDTIIVMFLQEMTPSDLDLITSSRWIQIRFNVTEKDGSPWLSPLTTLWYNSPRRCSP